MFSRKEALEFTVEMFTFLSEDPKRTKSNFHKWDKGKLSFRYKGEYIRYGCALCALYNDSISCDDACPLSCGWTTCNNTNSIFNMWVKEHDPELALQIVDKCQRALDNEFPKERHIEVSIAMCLPGYVLVGIKSQTHIGDGFTSMGYCFTASNGFQLKSWRCPGFSGGLWVRGEEKENDMSIVEVKLDSPLDTARWVVQLLEAVNEYNEQEG